MPLPQRVKLREVSPRDGFQSWPNFVPTDQKLEIIQALIGAGITEIETTSFVNPKRLPQMSDAAEVMARLPRTGCTYCVLAPNLKGAQMALETDPDTLQVFISASEPHNMANVRRPIADSMADLDPIFAMAEDKGVPVIGSIAVSFGCPYQGDVPADDVFRLVDAYLLKGASTIILSDTTGMASPPRIERLIRGYFERFSETHLGVHLHNNRGTAMVNLYAAMHAGVTMFDTALGGIGGCPNVPRAVGNLATEDVVCVLEDMGVDTGIDLVALIEASQQLEAFLGKTLPGQVMKSGPRDPELAARLCSLSCQD